MDGPITRDEKERARQEAMDEVLREANDRGATARRMLWEAMLASLNARLNTAPSMNIHGEGLARLALNDARCLLHEYVAEGVRRERAARARRGEAMTNQTPSRADLVAFARKKADGNRECQCGRRGCLHEELVETYEAIAAALEEGERDKAELDTVRQRLDTVQRGHDDWVRARDVVQQQLEAKAERLATELEGEKKARVYAHEETRLACEKAERLEQAVNSPTGEAT